MLCTAAQGLLKMRRQKIYSQKQTEKLNNLTAAEKERIDQINELVHQLLKQYDLETIKFEFGYGRFDGIFTGDRISLHLFVALNSPIKVIRNIILHEVAHAIVGIIHKHREIWQNKARELGVTWERRYHK